MRKRNAHNVPASEVVTVYAIVVLLADERAPVILGQERSVGLLPGLVLDFGRRQVLRERWEDAVPLGGAGSGEGVVVEPPEGPELAEVRKSAVDKVLVCADEVLVDDPVKFALEGVELHVDVVGRAADDGGVEPGEVARRAICGECEYVMEPMSEREGTEDIL